MRGTPQQPALCELIGGHQVTAGGLRRAGVASSDGRWRLGLYGKNLTDEYYWNNVVSSSDAVARFAARPATYGVDFSFRM